LVKFENLDQLIDAVSGRAANGAPTPSTDAHYTSEVDTHDVSETNTASFDAHNISEADAYNASESIGRTTNLPASTPQIDYYSMLLGAIENTKKNPEQLRALVYERARFNFKRDILYGYSSMRLTDLVQHVNEFELAVDRIEADSGGSYLGNEYQPDRHAQRHDTERLSNNAFQILPPAPFAPLLIGPNQFENPPDRRVDQILPNVRFANQLIVVLILGIMFIGTVIVAGVLWRSPLSSHIETADNLAKNGATAGKSVSLKQEEDVPKVPYPLPKSYGIYALSDNKLTELKRLPISVPDPRVAISAALTKASTTMISSNKPSFILFRRDLLNNAPQKVAVRVVAQLKLDTKIVAGKPSVTGIDGAWRIRNISKEFKVSPVPGQREMVIARPDENETLAAGRYALVMNRVGYDFTVEGPVKSPEFCIETFATANGSIFSQCPVQQPIAQKPAKAAAP